MLYKSRKAAVPEEDLEMVVNIFMFRFVSHKYKICCTSVEQNTNKIFITIEFFCMLYLKNFDNAHLKNGSILIALFWPDFFCQICKAEGEFNFLLWCLLWSMEV